MVRPIVTGQPLTLVCWSGHEWDWPRKKGQRPKACPAHDQDRKRAYFAEQSRRYHAENADRIAARKAAYRQTPEGAEVTRAGTRRRRARLRGAPEVDPTLTWQKVADRDGMECAYCPTVCDPQDYRPMVRRNGSPHKAPGPTYPTLDHVVPLIAGGAHTMGNAVLACSKCNSEKRELVI